MHTLFHGIQEVSGLIFLRLVTDMDQAISVFLSCVTITEYSSMERKSQDSYINPPLNIAIYG